MSEPPLPPQGRMVVVATDFDRTFTRQDLKLSPDAIQRARVLRAKGAKVILVTGRSAATLPLHRLTACFDAMVLEGGAVWGRPGHWGIHPDETAVAAEGERLEAQGFDVQAGWASFSVEVRAAAALQGSRLEVHRNRDRFDVTPAGTDKRSGLQRLLAEMNAVEPWVLAIGDSENDIPLFEAASHSVAVSNAVPELLPNADTVSPKAAHQGFLWATSRIGDRLTPGAR